MNYIKALQVYGLKGTMKRLYQFKDIKFGTYVGVDELGNKYYENLDLPSGQHRWVEPAHFDSGSLTDASWVSPTWHGWLHHTTDVVPPSTPGKVPERTGAMIAEGVHTPVSHHYNMEHRRPWRPNPTLARERGYGINHHFGKAGQNDFYVQPGHMQHPQKVEYGPNVESWEGAPTQRKPLVSVEAQREPWEKFLAQRRQMNKERGVSSK